jgi:hypothetical protein
MMRKRRRGKAFPVLTCALSSGQEWIQVEGAGVGAEVEARKALSRS